MTITADTPGTGVQTQYQAALDGGRFVIQHCAACGKHVFFPRENCPNCGAGKLSWVEPGGTGTVYAVTTVRRKADAGGDYNVSLVDLPEGVRLMSRVANLSPDEVRIGLAVRACVLLAEGKGQIVFDAVVEPAQSAINNIASADWNAS